MRGPDHQQSAMFSYLSPEQRVPSDHPLRAVRQMADTVLTQLSQVFSKMYSDIRPAVDSSGEIAACPTVASAVHGAQRAYVDGTVGIQPAVSVVRRLEHGRAGVGRDGVHQESGAIPASRHCQEVLRTGIAASPSLGSNVG